MNGNGTFDSLKAIPWGLILIGALVVLGGIASAIFALPFAPKQDVAAVVALQKENADAINKLTVTEAVQQDQITSLTSSIAAQEAALAKLQDAENADRGSLGTLSAEESELANEQKRYWDNLRRGR